MHLLVWTYLATYFYSLVAIEAVRVIVGQVGPTGTSVDVAAGWPTWR